MRAPTAETCKSRWQNLRDQFRKFRARSSAVRSGQAADNALRKYKYEDAMQFLVPFFQERQTLCSLVSSVSFSGDSNYCTREENGDVSGPPLETEGEEPQDRQPPQKRRRHRPQQNECRNDGNEDRYAAIHNGVLECAKQLKTATEAATSGNPGMSQGEEDGVQKELQDFFRWICSATSNLKRSTQERFKMEIIERLAAAKKSEET
ncbi:uncharacterized protein LOC143355036 [Halictus rubicundus]|uniref:uncharacterized protein LOC143355036 n=1 Tax=Halictus rubicundus TaxID=77578 RepID=UPI00403712F1